MTPAEFERHMESQKRLLEAKRREKAYFDYTLANLIGYSISRIHSSSAKFPTLEEAYLALFDSEEYREKRQQQQEEMTILRFKQFTQSHNKKFEEVGEKNE